MNLIPVGQSLASMLKEKHYKMGVNQALIMEFMNSDMDVAEVTNLSRWKNAGVGATSLNNAAKKMGVRCFAMSRKDKLYLVKDEI